MTAVKPLVYPGPPNTFYADLFLSLPRWLRFVSLVPLASLDPSVGMTASELSKHILDCISSSNDTADSLKNRIPSAVASMLIEEPFFQVRGLSPVS